MPSRVFRMPALIEPSLWSSAGWRSVAYLAPIERPPVMVLVFHDRDAASAIFVGWRRALGEIDVHDLLRISIVEGTLSGKPPGYSVHLGVDEVAAREAVQRAGAQEVIGTSHDAWLREAKPSSIHLRRFQEGFAQHRRYLLVPATFDVGLEVMPHFGIGKQRLAFRKVGDVGLVGDPDSGLWTSSAKGI